MNIKVPITSLLLFTSVLSTLTVASMGAKAMDKTIQCLINLETIIPLKKPLFNTPTVWNAFYGQDGMEQITDVALGAEGTFVIAGHYTKDKDDTVFKPFLAEIDGRGRVIWENRVEAPAHKTIKTLKKIKSGYASLGEVQTNKGKGFYLAIYDDKGSLKAQKPIYEAGYTLIPHDMAPSKTGKSVVIAASRLKNDKPEVVLYKITLEGKVLWRRQYSPGLATQLNAIDLAADGAFTLAGSIEQNNGTMAGWVVRVDDNGALMGQQAFPRGRSAELQAVRAYDDLSSIVSGFVKGVGEKTTAGWVMKLNPDGSVIWQRYYSGEADYKAPSLIAHRDGRASIMLDGTKASRFDRGHVSLLTLTPEGNLMNVESFTDGQNAQGHRLALGHYQERLVVGSAQSVMPDDQSGGDVSPYVFDGWVFAATALDPYDDLCKQGQ